MVFSPVPAPVQPPGELYRITLHSRVADGTRRYYRGLPKYGNPAPEYTYTIRVDKFSFLIVGEQKTPDPPVRVSRNDFGKDCPIFSCTHFQSIGQSMKNIARRSFLQVSSLATAGLILGSSRSVSADELPQLTEDDAMAQSMKYTHDASTVDASARANPAENQTCANCALVQGDDGDAWRPCQIFPGKTVNANGWCSVWAPKA